MNKIHILDCTLRDGGYCNNWNFGMENIKKILGGLISANIDIVECGYLTKNAGYNQDHSQYNDVKELLGYFPTDYDKNRLVVLMNYNEYDLEKLPDCKDSPLNGIRVAFHKKDRNEALEYCRKIMDKGYKVFIQPMVSLSYTDAEYLDLIDKVNALKPYAFYVVDSFGMMKKKNLLRLFYMVEHNLNKNIWIGFHSHNNMQLAYSNAQTLVDAMKDRDLIIDSSIFGMGRGAGNLNTELFVEYLNENISFNYDLKPLLVLIDDVLNDFYQKKHWGYSLPNYLSAKHNIHPNYAIFFSERYTLTVGAIDEIFNGMDPTRAVEYDKNYAEEAYDNYMKEIKYSRTNEEDLKEVVSGRKILLVAPGKSAESEKEKILSFSKENNLLLVSINYNFDEKLTDYIFISNLRRFRELNNAFLDKCITTTNIKSDLTKYRVDYTKLLYDIDSVKDNAGLMAIKLFLNMEVDKIYLAGYDGFSYNHIDNYDSNQREYVISREVIDSMNEGMRACIFQYWREKQIEFLTIPKNLDLKQCGNTEE